MKKYSILILSCCVLLAGCGNSHSISSDSEIPVVPQTTAPIATSTTVVATETAHQQETVSTETPDSVNLVGTNTLEVYSQITVEDFLTQCNVTLSNPEELVNTSVLGENQVDVLYELEGKSYQETLHYTVADTIEPVLLNDGHNAVMETGTAFEITDYVGYADNYDATPEISYTGTVDQNTAGTYPLTATVTDSSGNATTWDFTLTVMDEIPNTIDDSERVPFAQFCSQYAGSGRSFGIDVSKWQGDIDFQAVKNAGCEFVLMRIGVDYNGCEEDAYFQQNLARAKEAGLKIGVYIYSMANSEEEIKTECQWIANELNGTQLDFPVVFDWEDFGTFQEYEMSIYDLNQYFEVFCDTMEEYGYDAMLYSSKNFLNNFWENYGEHPVWLAHYVDETDYDGSYCMWQASSIGNIDGINGDVDFNILYE